MGFNPSSFPPIADVARLRTEAEKFKTKADKVEDIASDSFNSWSSMPGVYEAPEASIVYGAFAPVKTSGQDLAGDAATVKSAIDTYAGEAESIKGRYDALLVRWRSVEAQKAADDEWQEDEDLVKEDNDILSDANALMAEYMAAQRTCANKISGIYGGPTYVPTTQEGAGSREVQYGFTGEQLDAAAAEGKLPWGEPSEYDAPWYEDSWNAVKSFGKGVWSGVTGTVTGLWNMVNVGDMETFKATWKGIATLAVDAAVVSPIGMALSDPKRVKESQQRLIAVGKSAIHWDEWKEDPAYAAGASTFDLATILLTAGAGAVTKTGSTASKVATVAKGGSKASTAVKVTGLGAAARTTVKVTDLAADLKIKSLDLGTSVAQNSLGKLAPVATWLDDGINATSGPQPAHARVGSSGPRPFSDALDAGISRMDSHTNGGGSVTTAGGTAGLDSGSNAPATTVPDGADADSDADADAPIPGGHDDGPADRSTSDRAESSSDAPKATVAEWSEDGTPKTVQLPGPKAGTHTVSMSSDQLADLRVDGAGNAASSRDVIIQHANDHGVTADQLDEMIHKSVDDLSTDEVQTLVEIRHSIEPSGGEDTVFQKAIRPDRVDDMLNNTTTKPVYRTNAGGFVSDGADTAHLRTPQAIIEGLRLDYLENGGSPYDSDLMHLVRFQTPEIDGVGIPDEAARARLPEEHRYKDLPDLYENENIQPPPHSSNGFTTSEVGGERIIPEYSTADGDTVPMREGAEMWRINRAGEEVLVGIFDKKWIRVD